MSQKVSKNDILFWRFVGPFFTQNWLWIQTSARSAPRHQNVTKLVPKRTLKHVKMEHVSTFFRVWTPLKILNKTHKIWHLWATIGSLNFLTMQTVRKTLARVTPCISYLRTTQNLGRVPETLNPQGKLSQKKGESDALYFILRTAQNLGGVPETLNT